MRHVSFMSRTGWAQILIVETRMNTSGNQGRNRWNQGGSTIRTGGGTKLETRVEIKATKAETRAETEAKENGNEAEQGNKS